MISIVVLLSAAVTATTVEPPRQRSGYPKLFRCQSVIQRPVAPPRWSRACLDYRRRELDTLLALPVAERIARIGELRALMGLAGDEGLDVTPSGRLRAARGETTSGVP